MAFSTEITLTGQPRGKELEYGVVAANKAGEGPVNNTVMAVFVRRARGVRVTSHFAED
uniref:Fibronectin type-III domain-containing protein n=1 Tax=Candidatus Kentrum sp. LFY TaxID=2126342 RepID=A0A450V9S7_9GAMM|nr:MAG: hypothetical protein BECKLFY1418A_GA0070994_11512 [Candidatus Kentron sp. LFY]